jgi:hypothetical protein
MRVLAVLVVAACQTDHPDNPLEPGGPGGPGSMVPPHGDAGVGDAGDGGAGIAGRVCLVRDLRAPETACANVGADGITVTLGTKTALTDATGAFTIETPLGSNLTWHATRNDLVPSVAPFSGDLLIPAVTADDFNELLTDNGVLLSEGQGSVIVRVVQTGMLLAGAKATSAPVAQFGPFYDSSDKTVWNQNVTGPLGVVWISGAAVGATTLTITPPSGTAQQTILPVEDLAITYATVEFP